MEGNFWNRLRSTKDCNARRRKRRRRRKEEEEEDYLYADYVSDENFMVRMKVMKIMWWENGSNTVWGLE
jgi:hypothetical protein